MRYKLLHQSAGRARIHLYWDDMSLADADYIEYFLENVPGVIKASVNHRNSNVVLRFEKGASKDIKEALKDLSYQGASEEVTVYRGNSRAINLEYENKIIDHIAVKAFKTLFVPMPIRTAITAFKSVRYIFDGIKCLLKGQLKVAVLDAASILVSMIRGDFSTASNVMFLLKLGDYIDEWTHKKSLDDLARTMVLNVEKVWLRAEGKEDVLVDVNSVEVGDWVVVRTGNLIPFDGTVVEGEAEVNQASMTGEPLPVNRTIGGYVYAGTVVDAGEIVVEVKKAAGNSKYDRIVTMIQDSEKLKSEKEAKASLLADRLVPYSFGATILTYLLTRNVTKATSILMVDFCCALKLSMPIASLSAMRQAGDNHMLVKGAKFLEAVAEADTIVFDKTGTLTNATPTFVDIVPLVDQDKNELLRLAACLEEHYPHSIANAVLKAASDLNLEHEERHTKVEYVVAHGIVSSYDEKKVVIGSRHFVLEDEAFVIPEGMKEKVEALSDSYSKLYMGIDGVLVAIILIEDQVRPEVPKMIKELHKLGVKNTVMMTGDNYKTAEAVAKVAGIDTFYAEVLPEDKASFIEQEKAKGHKVIMVGDGVNDSPALSAADAGVSIQEGAAIAREVADIVISESDMRTLIKLRKLSMALSDRIDSNYRTIISFNSMLILLGITGVLTPITTALLHNSSTIMIAMNSMTDMDIDRI